MILKALVGVVSGITKNAREKKIKKEKMKLLNASQEQLDENYFIESNKNYLDNGEPKMEVLQLNEQKANQDLLTNSEVMKIGASPEAEIAKAAEVNKEYSNAVKRLAKPAFKKKEALKKEYEKKSQSIADKKATLGIKKTSLFNQMF